MLLFSLARVGRQTTSATTPTAHTARCVVCACPVEVHKGHRPRRYCSDACKSAAYRRRTAGHKTHGLVRLVQGDARDVLAGMASESVDLVVTDPPYLFARGTTYFRAWFAMLRDEAWPGVCRQFHRVLPSDRHAYVVCDRRSHPVLASAATVAGFRVAATLVWDKMSPGLGRGAYRAQHELVLFLQKGHRDPNCRDLGDVLRFPRVVRGYPTEKPVGLWKTLIGQSTRAGERSFVTSTPRLRRGAYVSPSWPWRGRQRDEWLTRHAGGFVTSRRLRGGRDEQGVELVLTHLRRHRVRRAR